MESPELMCVGSMSHAVRNSDTVYGVSVCYITTELVKTQSTKPVVGKSNVVTTCVV
jgi:hypothetical protein